MHGSNSLSQIFYRPIEAAIRWAGLLKYQHNILPEMTPSRHLPERLDCPRWGELRLCTDRIYDAIVNGELPYGRDGITLNDPALWDSPDLTIRHIDLKRWMRDHYPEQRPRFLFSRRERLVHPAITLETGHAMLIERQALRVQLEHCRRDLRSIQELYDSLSRQRETVSAPNQCPLSDRAESTYLHIIGSLLELMLGHSPSGVPYSSFKTQEAIVSALIANHSGIMGITERTLNGKFASARRKIRSAIS
ncbi:hypothetical protein [Marinobacterium rhizophilum]|uniref:Receptor protein-tyrosine kinase n=1 Tax=Marinobacterium rhizophilum TaxID=420402 RepID=A0ABY5HJ51_9GAMM|nr:hypothetical protein [Marinobacterium rhizophilum]UTW12405.1 hypothetical protein KDW95_01595 [Marinobacterium rhizophilum]